MQESHRSTPLGGSTSVVRNLGWLRSELSMLAPSRGLGEPRKSRPGSRDDFVSKWWKGRASLGLEQASMDEVRGDTTGAVRDGGRQRCPRGLPIEG